MNRPVKNKSKSNPKNISNVQRNIKSNPQILLEILIVISLLGAMFFWTKNLYMAFWLRRFFVGMSGLLSLFYLMKFHIAILKHYLQNRVLIFLLILTTVSLLISSNPRSALFGSPLVHPSLLSLYASFTIGMTLTTYSRDKVLEYSLHAINFWAVCNFIFWLVDTKAKLRLGFLDSQVIYAACLFAVGIILGFWHYKFSKLNKKYLLSSIFFLSLCLLLSQTRSAMILMVAVLLYGFNSSFLRRKHIIAPMVIAAVVLLFIGGSYFSRLHNGKYLIKSFVYRTDLIRASFSIHPAAILFGGGISSIEKNISKNAHNYPELDVDIKDGIKFESSHNYLVDLIVERGVIVSVLFMAILYSAFKSRSQNQAELIEFYCLVFLFIFLLVNNINLQMEIMLWSLVFLRLAHVKFNIIDSM